MSVSNTATRTPYTGNGSTTSFATVFQFQGAGTTSELTVVKRIIATGVESTLTYTTDYTVTGGNGETGTVIAATAPANTVEWHIIRNTTQSQTADYVENDPFPADAHERALDRLAMVNQEQETDLGKAFKYSDTYTGNGSTVMPEPAAGKGLVWNSGGTALESSTDDFGTSASAAATSATAAASSATSAASSASTATAQATLATAYAVKVDGVAAGSDHSSKAWAVGGTGITDTSSKGAAKEWAVETSGTVDGTSFSSKEYAAGTQGSTGGSSKSWAQDADQVNGADTNDRSAKAWSQGASMTGSTLGGASKDWAQVTGGTVDGTLFSSKEHAQGVTSGNGGSSKQWSLGGGSFDVDTAITGSDFSAKKYAANAAASASQAASGQIYSTVVNQTSATLSPALSADGTYFLCDTSSNNITITLPAIGTSEGVKYAFQKTSASNSLIFSRSGTDTLNGAAGNITITDVNAQIQFVSDNASPDNWVGVQMSQVTVGTGLSKTGSVISIDQTHLKQVIAIACSDETTALAAATAVATFHMPYSFTVTGVKASVTTAPVGSVLTVDLNEAGSTILTTKLTIDAGEKTSATAATAAVVGGAGPALADNALMTVDLDGVGSGTAGTGLKIYLIGYAT